MIYQLRGGQVLDKTKIINPDSRHWIYLFQFFSGLRQHILAGRVIWARSVERSHYLTDVDTPAGCPVWILSCWQKRPASVTMLAGKNSSRFQPISRRGLCQQPSVNFTTKCEHLPAHGNQVISQAAHLEAGYQERLFFSHLTLPFVPPRITLALLTGVLHWEFMLRYSAKPSDSYPRQTCPLCSTACFLCSEMHLAVL